MRGDRPVPLAAIERDQMHQLVSRSAENRSAARRTLLEARSFQTLAELGLETGLSLPAVSNFHEAARLSVTAIATLNGYRFRNAPGAHEAVVDYALAIGIVDTKGHAQLDQLRQLRHDINYPADLVEPSRRELDVIASLVTSVIGSASEKLPAPRIPPPPDQPRR